MESIAFSAADATGPNWLTERLAIGGRFPPAQAARLAEGLGLRAVIDLRAEDCDDADCLRRHGLAFLHLPTPDHHPPGPADLERGLAFASAHIERAEPVLVHCEHGIGRSALLALCLLVDQGMEPLEALALAKERRPVVSPSPAQYRAWAVWLASRGRPVPDFDAFAAIAYRHLG